MLALLEAKNYNELSIRRWRLQKAFYHKDSVGCTGCKGIGLQDICPLWSCLSQNKQESVNEDEMEAGKRPMSLADLKGMKPEYISNMVVNRWKISHESEEKYELLTMSATGIERFDCDPNENHFEGRLEPKDVMLSDAMATSAAALSSHMGKYDRSLEGLTRLHSILGLEMGATMISDVKSLKNEDLSIKVCLSVDAHDHKPCNQHRQHHHHHHHRHNDHLQHHPALLLPPPLLLLLFPIIIVFPFFIFFLHF